MFDQTFAMSKVINFKKYEFSIIDLDTARRLVKELEQMVACIKSSWWAKVRGAGIDFWISTYLIIFR